MATLLDIVRKAATDRSVTLRIIDATDGTPETGVVWNSAGIDLWYRRESAAKVSITEATLAALTTAHTDGGFLHIGDGEYRFDLPDAAVATGANHVEIGGTVTGMVVIGGRIRLVDYDPENAMRMGMTALPNASADGAGGLPISDLGGLDMDAMNAAAVRLTAARAQVLDDWIDGGRLDLILDGIQADLDNPTDGLGALKTLIDAIQADLDNGTDGLGALRTLLLDIPTVTEFNARTLASANYTLASVLGTLTDAASAGDPTTADTLMQYMKQLVNTLEGTAGVPTMPASAPPANNVSMVEMLRAVYDDSNELQTDWQGGGRLDNLLDSVITAVITNAAGADVAADIIALKAVADVINTATGGLGGAAMRGTNSAALAAVATEARLAELDAGNLPGDLVTVLSRLPAALVGGLMNSLMDDVTVAAARVIRDEILPVKNTSFPDIPVLFVAASDHVTPVTGATGSAVTRSIDGGAFGAGTGTFAEVANGMYQYDASAADMNGDIITFRFTATGGTPGAPDDVFITIRTGG